MCGIKLSVMLTLFTYLVDWPWPWKPSLPRFGFVLAFEDYWLWPQPWPWRISGLVLENAGLESIPDVCCVWFDAVVWRWSVKNWLRRRPRCRDTTLWLVFISVTYPVLWQVRISLVTIIGVWHLVSATFSQLVLLLYKISHSSINQLFIQSGIF